MVEEHKSYHDRYLLTLIFASVFLFSFGMVSHNAFADQVVASIPVGTNPTGVAVNPTTNEIYIANEGGTVSVIDGSTNSVTSTIPVDSLAEGVAVNPITNMVYVVFDGKRELDVINGSTNTLVQTILINCDCGGNLYAQGVAVDPATNMIYVTIYSAEHFGNVYDASSSIVEINGTTNTEVSYVDVAGWARGVAVNQDTNMIYSTTYAPPNTNANYVYAIDGSTNSVVANMSVPNNPAFIATNPRTNMVYASEGNGSQLVVIDGSTNTILSNIPIGNDPLGVAVNSVTNKVYVANNGNNTVSVIDGSSNQVLDTISVGSRPYLIDVNSNTNRIYVANEADNTVSVIDGSITAPQPPTGLTATGKLLQISLNWNAPADNGGAPVTGYMIERSTNGGSTWSTIVSNTGNTGTTYTDKNVLPLTTYTYRVFAINDVGTSGPSNTASATTLSVGPITPPSLP